MTDQTTASSYPLAITTKGPPVRIRHMASKIREDGASETTKMTRRDDGMNPTNLLPRMTDPSRQTMRLSPRERDCLPNPLRVTATDPRISRMLNR